MASNITLLQNIPISNRFLKILLDMHLSEKGYEDSTTTFFMNKALRKAIIHRPKWKSFTLKQKQTKICATIKNKRTSV